MSWLSDSLPHLLEAAAKAAFMYAIALIALRLGERRTLAQWTAIDFVAAVALGAIVGRTAVARTQDLAVGVVALIAVLVAHQLAARARFHPFARRVLEHGVTVLVAHGQIQRAELRRAALTESDLFAALRQRGVFSLSGLQYVLYEARGGLSIVDDDGGDDRELITSVLAEHPIK